MSAPGRAARLAIAWGALIALLAASTALAYAPLGRASLAVALFISAAKAAVILVVFMELLRSSRLVWVVAAAGLCWLAILIGMPSIDYLSRRDEPLTERSLDRTVIPLRR